MTDNKQMQKMTSDYPVIKLDRQLKVNFLNEAAAKFLHKLGISQNNILGHSIASFSPELGESSKNCLNGTCSSNNSHIGKDWVKCTLHQLVNDNGECEGVYINPEIVTELVNNEQSIKLAQSEIQSLVDEAYKGNLNTRINANKFSGFYKQLAERMNGLMDTIVQPLSVAIDTIKHMAKGDLSKKIDHDYQGAFGEIKSSINETLSNLHSMISDINHSAQSINTASNEINSGNHDLAHRTEKQAFSIDKTSKSLNAINTAIKKNSEDAETAKGIASNTKDLATKGGKAVNETIESIKSIETASQKIVAIISVIDEIAFQTNLLALNAAVEAARAGEAGKGFAVVAQEVRTLAGRSASASKEIKELITDSVDKVKTCVNVAQKSGEDLNKIVNSVSTLTDTVVNIASATIQQAQVIQEITTTIDSIDDATQQNAALVEENTSATQSMSDQITTLTKLIQFFKIDSNEEAKNANFPIAKIKKPKTEAA